MPRPERGAGHRGEEIALSGQTVAPPSRRRRLALALAAIYPGVLLLLGVVQRLWPREGGPLALAAVGAPFLLLPVGALLPLLPLRGAAALRLTVAACLLLGLRDAPRLPQPTPVVAPGAALLTVMTWNVAFGHADPRAIQRFVESRPADVVILVEDYTSWWDPDPAVWRAREAALERIYPYQVRYLHGAPQGLTILSTFPIIERATIADDASERETPPLAWGRLDLGQGRALVVAAAHPRNPTRDGCSPRRLCYDPAGRDAQVARIRAIIDPFLARGEPLLLAGDFNLTDREVAYAAASRGLWDAHRAVGSGTGNTWRPFALADGGLPLLRIDYLFGSPGVQPVRLARDCTARGSDHCALIGQIAVR